MASGTIVRHTENHTGNFAIEQKTSGWIQPAKGWNNAEADIAVSKSGYTPIAIVGYNTSNNSSGGQETNCYPRKLYLSGTNVHVGLVNWSDNTDAKVVFQVKVLYRKD